MINLAVGAMPAMLLGGLAHRVHRPSALYIAPTKRTMSIPLLTYQPSHSAVHYTPPSTFNPKRTFGLTLAALVCAIIGGLVYAAIQPKLHHLFFRTGAVAVAAVVVGVLGGYTVRRAHVELPVLAAFIGALIAMAAIYSMWLAWVHNMFFSVTSMDGYPLLITHPLRLLNTIALIESRGTWSYTGDQVRGFHLFVLWMLESGAILACGLFVSLKAIKIADPVCSGCKSRCQRVKLPRFAGDQRREFVATIERRDFKALPTFAPPANEIDPELSLEFFSCPNCGQTQVLSVDLVGWVRNSQGTAKVERRPLLKRILITPDEAEQLVRACAELLEQQVLAQSESKEE